jgi:uncharacterized cofD-like protein
MDNDKRLKYRINTGIGPKIVVIGGGTGLSVVLRGLKAVTDNLTAIVTVADDGGGSGMLREDLGMLPPGDIRSCILAMADEESDMQQVLQYRFTDGILTGQNFGNLLIAALNGIYGNFEDAVAKTHDILRVKGRVIPVTGADVQLCAELEDGRIICGESKIQPAVISAKSSIKRVFLKPEKPEGEAGAIQAIKEADIIVMGPGSLYSSIVVNFLVGGIGEAVIGAKGIKALICNVMTQPGETDFCTVYDHVMKVNEYIGKEVIDYVLVNNQPVSEAIMDRYTKDGASQLMMQDKDRKKMSDKGIHAIESSFIEVRTGFVRHDAQRIANVILKLVQI